MAIGAGKHASRRKDHIVSQEIVEGDWVLVCETNERGQIVAVFDKGERFMVKIDATEAWPFPKNVHVMIEKIRKIKKPKPREKVWYQVNLFGENE